MRWNAELKLKSRIDAAKVFKIYIRTLGKHCEQQRFFFQQRQIGHSLIMSCNRHEWILISKTYRTSNTLLKFMEWPNWISSRSNELSNVLARSNSTRTPNQTFFQTHNSVIGMSRRKNPHTVTHQRLAHWSRMWEWGVRQYNVCLISYICRVASVVWTNAKWRPNGAFGSAHASLEFRFCTKINSHPTRNENKA